jgi:8-oxo-dGTP diphosphatase
MNDPKVGVAVIIHKGGEVLLIKRKNVHGSGTWSTPGGHLDYGESPEECARRETREEVGVEIGNVRFRAVTNDVFEAISKHYITLWMESDHLSGEPYIAADYEVGEIGWFTMDALPTPLFQPLESLLHGECYPLPGG